MRDLWRSHTGRSGGIPRSTGCPHLVKDDAGAILALTLASEAKPRSARQWRGLSPLGAIFEVWELETINLPG